MKHLYIYCLYQPKLFLLTSLALSLHGCGVSAFTHRDTNPSIQDINYSKNIIRNFFGDTSLNSFTTTASRRMVLVRENKDQSYISCAEPSPDVAEAFASAIADGFKIAAKEPKSGITIDAANQYARAVATQIAPLVYRTQGLQFYRDSLYNLCIDKMNGWITNDEYQQAKLDRAKQAFDLIENEKDVMLEAQKSFFASVKAGNAGIDINDLTKIVEAVKPPATSTTTTTTPNSTTTTVNTPLAKATDKTHSCNDGKAPTGNPLLCSDGKSPQ